MPRHVDLSTSCQDAALVDADLVLGWTVATARRWLGRSLGAQLAAASPAARRPRARAIIIETAAVMAAGAGRCGGPCSTNAARIAEWLESCVDALAEPDGNTSLKDIIPGFGPARDPRHAPLRRWNAALRETTEQTGVGWLRGLDRGPARATVSHLGGCWTVVEHGWGGDEQELGPVLIEAVATATVREAYARGRPLLPAATMVDALRASARQYCASEVAQRPSVEILQRGLHG